jgi:hypothetical protein
LSGFEAYDLEKIQLLRNSELDAAPFGVIVIDRIGTVLEYNAYERSLFCRRGAGHGHPRVSIEPFEFVFAFPHGPERVSVVFVRLADDRDRATICVIRTEVADP